MIGLTQLLIGLFVVGVIAILVISGKARVLLKGFVNLFVEDMAATPEGAEALYSQKEDDVKESLRAADEVYKKIAGQLSRYESELEELQKSLPKIEADSQQLARRGDREGLYIKSQERTDTIEEIENHKAIVDKLQKAKEDADRARKDCEANLDRIKKEHKRVVTSLKQNAEMKKIYADLDGIGADDHTTELLEKVKERSQDLDDLVEGSRQAYESKLSTRKTRLNERLRTTETDEYAEKLLNQYSTPLLEDRRSGSDFDNLFSSSSSLRNKETQKH
jgi:hypothetical protein